MPKSKVVPVEEPVVDDETGVPQAAKALEIFNKGMQRNGKWDKDNFPEFYSVIYWLRQIIALAVGVASGILGVTGVAGFILYGLAIVFLPFFYYSNYANVNVDDFGAMDLISEGLQQSLGVFVLSWILVFSSVHF